MSNLHDLDSNDWEHRSRKSPTHVPHERALANSSLAASPSLLQSTSTALSIPRPEVTKAASAHPDQSSCLLNCRDVFRDSILSYDNDFHKICNILANENGDVIFHDLYICDEGCGVMVGASQDAIVNWIISRCESLGYFNLVDPGPPPTGSNTTTLSPSLSTSVNGLLIQATSSNLQGNGQETATISQTVTPSKHFTSLLSSSFTNSPNALSSRPALASTSVPLSDSINVYFATTTTTRTSIAPAISTISYTPTLFPSLFSASILGAPSITPTSSSSPLSFTQTPSSRHTSSSPTSTPPPLPKMDINTEVGLILTVIGIVFLFFAVIIVIFVRQRQRTYFRTLITKHRNKEKCDSQIHLAGDSEAGHCSCITRRHRMRTRGIVYPQSSEYSRSTSGRSPSRPPKVPPKDRRYGAYYPQFLFPSQDAEVEELPISPVVVTVDGIRHELHHPAPNRNLMVDEHGIRWPERVELRGEAKEFLDWSRDYDRKDAEKRARDTARREAERKRASEYDLEQGRREKQKRYERKVRGGQIQGGRGRGGFLLESSSGMRILSPANPRVGSHTQSNYECE
ncbi:uncharacterized protein LY89DRAFT_106818 [Mollisia scopiformis]|uniref:Uncharacterized protein n=1 Tax=Mollisia scopiformis TaxID=149040 RepID=A0A194X4X7_MOLSC|nr:uncharacterized protein LY89DRAFT_106818 [Mollisia scopiformis]KUJ15230.1 hypothetical protein LY89DRAFT_106818 [Mollisia scopiformis]